MKRVKRRPLSQYRAAILAAERKLLLKALNDSRRPSSWNVTRAARALGLPLSTMKYKMKQFRLK